MSLRESIDYKALSPYSYPWGVSFSPNDSLIYVSMINTVYQYDRYATSLASSTVLLTIPDTNPYTWYNKHYGILQLAPNGRIYAAEARTTLYNSTGQPIGYTRGWLSEIRYPNRRGLACGLRDSVVQFREPYIFYASLPNCIDSDMGFGAAFVSVSSHHFCVGDSLRVQASMKGFSGDYAPQMQVWYSDSDSVLVQGYAATHTYTQAGQYTLRVRLWESCSGRYRDYTDSVEVLGCEPPRLSLSCLVSDTCGQSVGTVSYASIGGAVDSLRWDMDGDGVFEYVGEQAPLLHESRAGVRRVGLWCKNRYGRDTVHCELSFQPQDCSSYYFVPNVFTRNADGVNDRWELSSRGYGLERLWVYNRWGVRVHDLGAVGGLPPSSVLWDGGQQSAGVYFYVLELKESATGRKVQIKGTVELMR
ncbi:C-terminal domain of CHU protein family protein [Flexibacter flexilis DSM 6793]|uniref:C-terminal domain of CHU protein family protein n=1 Tax=Flexibacter flexilis DSM 6793 TaxID=927664 RepID=A0A1I1E6S6_9BACT|nr:C-terminal domain of CHU protein family protein [Flexibacter flexilis DSM 6793]